MVERTIAKGEAEAIRVGAAHLRGELGEPRTEREAWFLVLVAVTVAADMAARHNLFLGSAELPTDKLARYWGDELMKHIERAAGPLRERRLDKARQWPPPPSGA